jgi:hypothetical protein
MCAATESDGDEPSQMQYTPICQAEIRLLTLLRGRHSRIQCRLDTHSQNLAPAFDAISYCWGESTVTTPIICNGKTLLIRLNLCHALKHIMNGTAKPIRPIWADAVCLNQSDNVEKAQQVPRMGNIYRLATRTLIWLGPAEHESDRALNFMRNMRRPGRKWSIRNKRLLDDLGCSAAGKAMVASILKLMKRSYFERLWVVQELLISTSCVVLCGSVALPWSAFADFLSFVRPCGYSRPIFLEGTDRGAAQHEKYTIDRILLLETNRYYQHRNHSIGVRTLMELCEGKRCAEPIDYIWATSALYEQNLQKALLTSDMIDYSVTGRTEYWKAYTNFMKLCSRTVPQEFSYMVFQGVRLQKHTRLPSWCPDFSAVKAREAVAWAGCRAGFLRGIHVPLSLLGETALLPAAGFVVDHVKSTTDTLRVENYMEWQRCRTWIHQCCLLAYEAFKETGHVSTIRMLCRTLGGHCFGYGFSQAMQRESLEILEMIYYDVCRRTVPTEDVLGRTYSQIEVAFRYGRGRRFFTTHGRRMGLGPPDMQEDDLVCIIKGEPSAYILRPADKESLLRNGVHPQSDLDAHPELFTLLGDAYLHGCMDGEAFTAPDREPDRDFILA